MSPAQQDLPQAIPQDIPEIISSLESSFKSGVNQSYKQRIHHLRRFHEMILNEKEEIFNALELDLVLDFIRFFLLLYRSTLVCLKLLTRHSRTQTIDPALVHAR